MVKKKIIWPTGEKKTLKKITTTKKKSVYLIEKSNLMMTSNYLQDNTENYSGRISIQQKNI